MDITEIKIFPFEPGDIQKNLKGFAQITLNESLVIKGIKIFERENGGIFIAYPALQGRDRVYHDIVVPISAELKQRIRDAVVAAYKNEKESS